MLRIAALALLLFVCLPPHLLFKALSGRSPMVRRFLAAAGWICGVRVEVTGAPAGPHTLLVCNHVSWLDIFVVGGATGCRFVAKHELGHPLVHWLADQGRTLYVRRDHRKGAPHQAQAIASALTDPQPLALFPEGTTGPGTHLLPFRSTLFSAVAPAPPGASVRPVAIDYGEAAAELGWFDEPGKRNVLRVLGRSKTIAVELRLLEALPAISDRKALAAAARDAIEQALASSEPPTRLYAAA